MKTTIVLYLSQIFWPSYTIPLDLLTLLFNRSNVMNSRKKNSFLIHDEELIVLILKYWRKYDVQSYYV